MAWYHEYDGGRAFYTALGHTEESYAEPLFLAHLLGGIRYAIGEGKALNYSKARTAPIPEEDRFVKTMLTQGTLFEPTEMAVLPNLDILLIQRRGEVMLLNGKTNAVKQVGFLKAYNQTKKAGVNAEEGVLGLAIDPDFTKNNYVYIFYSPIDTSVNRLSRFVFKNNKLEAASEKVILQFYSQREICCHTGGSIAFGKDNLLYLSTGDNSTPFNEAKQAFVNNGYAPLNDAPGHEQYDARRSSGNSNDLRGKILRIRIKPDGSYEIPEGNLFDNTPKARPEIFVMGNRNPYRISVDQKTGFLYWGEVGPDAGNDSLATRGPKGYDEVNQARTAGFFGWPLFVGNNYAYRDYNYETGQTGKVFDPQAPVNESRNNTGLTVLPPAQPAFIWYPYSASTDFPQVGTGGRNAMAGPVYYGAAYNHPNKIPEYYNGKLFVYDWIRGWVKAVSMLPNGDFDKMESFMHSTKFNSPIDMELGP
jgi:glucose/arabinose dehydrogenase